MRSKQIATPQVLALVTAALCGLLLAPGLASGSACPNDRLSGRRLYLPDCRAYEMVTPPYKGGFSVSLDSISESGTQLLGRSLGVFSNLVDIGSISALYSMKRTSLGWESIPLDAPRSTFLRFEVLATSPDFTGSLWTGSPPSPRPVNNLYHATSPQGPFVLVGPEGPAENVEALNLVGASRDLSHSVYAVDVPNLGGRSQLWPGDRTVGAGQVSLYEYSGTGNLEPDLVGVSDEHAVAHIGESHLISECGTFLGAPRGSAYNAISESGATIFFTALGRDYGECGGLPSGVVEPPVNELYARMDGSRTVAISEPSKADCEECDLSGPADAEFQGASADGSKVFFTTVQRLLPNAGAGVNLYEYDLDGPEGGRVTLVSVGDPAGARIGGPVQVSEDGSHVYFVAQGVLITTPNLFGRRAEENAQNLYVYERDGTYPMGHLAFIAIGGAGTEQATPDGRFLVFESAADLTPDQEGQAEAGQVFEYDAQVGSLVRVSRGQNGYNNDGNTNEYRASIPSQVYHPDLPAYKFTKLALSNNGAYVFFTSEDALTPQAVNGAANVYEYHAGQVFLISDGHDFVRIFGEPAVELLGTDESGQDVFFVTADSLLPQDTDTQVDIYDARVEGGFPLPAMELGCSEDPCQGPLASAPPQSPPLTLSSAGESALSATLGAPAGRKTAPKQPKKKAKRKRLGRRLHKGKKATRGKR